MRLIGLDPGLRITGWGIIEIDGTRLRHVAHGIIRSQSELTLAQRLGQIFVGVQQVIAQYEPAEAAIEQTFVNKNPESTLKLGHARGVVMLAPAHVGIAVYEYGANQVKKSVVGAGHAGKEQVALMVRRLLPGTNANADAADALAVAICHAHFMGSRRRWSGEGKVMAGAR
jgi:crossover junction endodeoxyribonuclease RuvC